MSGHPYSLKRPREWSGGLIFASPHSGSEYPEWFRETTSLPLNSLRSSEDAFVDRLIDAAPEMGAVTLSAHMPRCLIDLNRGAEEIDPQVVSGVPHHPLNQRTLAGLGVIPRVVAQGRTIHDRKLSRAEAERRIELYWRPYHAMLGRLVQEALVQFGQALLVDMHSMPQDALSHLQGTKPDIVLGNRHGLSSSSQILDRIAGAFEAENFTVRRNSPFSGAYICSTYGHPGRNVHVVQVEINRALYMSEATITPLPGFDDFAARITGAVQRISGHDPGDAVDERIAAE